jgi:hypothetical protein
MRRLLRDISERRQLGDVTTLANAAMMDEIAGLAESAKKNNDDEEAAAQGADSVPVRKRKRNLRSAVSRGVDRALPHGRHACS